MFADIGQNIGNALVSALAVAGAGVVGYFLTFVVLWVISKLALDRKIPKPVTRLLCVLGGVALAIFVAGFLFHGEGGGWGFGPGWGFGTGSGSGSGDTRQSGPERTGPAPSTGPSHTAPANGGTEAGSAAPLRILLLGGTEVKGETPDQLTAYRILPDGTVHTFAEIKSLIRKGKESKPPLRGIVIITRPESVAPDHVARKQLEQFASDERLAITHEKD